MNGGPLTCADLVALTPGDPMPMWESAERHPPEHLDRLLDAGADVARSMLDAESLIFYHDLRIDRMRMLEGKVPS